MSKSNDLQVNQELLDNVRVLLSESRFQLKQTVNSTMVRTYWHIGRLIMEDEQQGATRAREFSSEKRLPCSFSSTADGGGPAFRLLFNKLKRR